MSGLDFEDARAALELDGFVVLPERLSSAGLEAAREHADSLFAQVAWSDSDFDGRRTRRVYSLIARLGALTPLVLDPLVSRLVDDRLGDVHQLGMLFLTSVDPGEVPQMPHFDAGIYPLGRTIEAETNVVWALDEFTEDNGATRVARGSHRWDASRHPEPDELESVEMPAGSALVYSGNLWHAAGENRSERSRRALISEHVLPWLRPADNHLLDIPIDELSALPIELLRIAGLAPASDYLGFVGGRHPEEWLRDRVRSQS